MDKISRSDSFNDRVYRFVREIPRGQVSTYGRIAEACGSPRASRAVGTALHNNPTPVVTPCHRVVNREGRLAPGFAFGGPDIQRALLEAEGVEVSPEGYVDLERHLFTDFSSGNRENRDESE